MIEEINIRTHMNMYIVYIYVGIAAEHIGLVLQWKITINDARENGWKSNVMS